LRPICGGARYTQDLMILAEFLSQFSAIVLNFKALDQFRSKNGDKISYEN
jgi:hypothetical protein